MNINDIVNIIVNNGVAVFIVGYFVYRDYKFNDTLVKALTEMMVTLKDMKNDMERGGEHEN